MKREGRQHGMVRSYPILPSPWNVKVGSLVNQLDSPPTAGLFTKVKRKPTNHSKFTGKCGRPRCVGCHDHPACKSKGKAKGTHKLRSSDVVANHRLVSWRVVDRTKPAGSTATGISDYFADEDDGCYVAYYGDNGGDMVEEEKGWRSEAEIGFDVEDEIDEDSGWCLV